jgi:hypothetical protein
MKRYPKFLKTLPEFYGLSFYEIGALVVGLYIAMLFELSPLYTLIVSLLSIATLKVVKKNFDFKTFFLPTKKELDLSELERSNR